jgi:hypothetical protein
MRRRPERPTCAGEGTPAECVLHAGSPRQVEGLAPELRQTEFTDGEREQPFLYINGQEMSANAAVPF